MKPAELKALRRELKCTAGELADALGTDLRTVKAWEREELFPTRPIVRLMTRLREEGPDAIPRRRKKRGAKALTAAEVLADPKMWLLFRKLVAHAELRAAAMKLADGYPDPVD